MSHNRTYLYFTIQFWNANDTWDYNDGNGVVIEFNSKREAEERVKHILLKDSSIFAAKIFRVSKDEVAHIDRQFHMKTHEELFDHIKQLAFRVDDLKGSVQNDFNRMLADGTVTKEYLKISREETFKSFEDIIEELRVVQLDVYNLIGKFAE